MLNIRNTSHLEKLESYLSSEKGLLGLSCFPIPKNKDTVKTGSNRRKEKLLKLLMRLKEAHQHYKLHGSDPIKHQEIIDRSERLIDKLEQLGMDRTFSEALLFFGKEFLDFEYPGPKNIKSNNGLRNKRIRREKGTDIVSKVEEIFGVKARHLTPEEVKIHNQVPKNALIYEVKDGKPKVLAYRKIKGVPPQA